MSHKIEMYRVNPPFHFGCNEEDEVEIVVHNADSEEQAAEKVKQFLKLIRNRNFKITKE